MRRLLCGWDDSRPRQRQLPTNHGHAALDPAGRGIRAYQPDSSSKPPARRARRLPQEIVAVHPGWIGFRHRRPRQLTPRTKCLTAGPPISASSQAQPSGDGRDLAGQRDVALAHPVLVFGVHDQAHGHTAGPQVNVRLVVLDVRKLADGLHEPCAYRERPGPEVREAPSPMTPPIFDARGLVELLRADLVGHAGLLVTASAATPRPDRGTPGSATQHAFAEKIGARSHPAGRAWRGWYTPSLPPPGSVMRVRSPQPSSRTGSQTMCRLFSSPTKSSTSAHMR